MPIMSTKDRKAFEKYQLFLHNLPRTLAECPDNLGKLRELIERVNDQLERFARPYGRDKEAMKLRSAEQELIRRVQVLEGEKAERQAERRALRSSVSSDHKTA